jgi:hypothetical protein
MLGAKKTLPLWRRPNHLALERALASQVRVNRTSDAEQAVIERKLDQYRFEVSKGRIHPPSE